MFPVTIKAKSLYDNQGEAIEWAQDISNYNADMMVKDIKVLGDTISFEIGFEGMSDAQAIDIKTSLDEYIEMDDLFQATNKSIIYDNRKYEYDLKSLDESSSIDPKYEGISEAYKEVKNPNSSWE